MGKYLFQIELDTKKILQWYEGITLEQAEKIIEKIMENQECLYDGIFAVVDSIKDEVMNERQEGE